MRRTTPPGPRRSVGFHLLALALTSAIAGALLYVAKDQWSAQPARGYTSFGLWAGGTAAALLLAAWVYMLRRRGLQERLPGRLQTWLRVHVWIGLLAVWLALLHAGFHVDDTLGAVLLIAFAFVVVTGLVGWWFYVRVPGHGVVRGPGHMASVATEREIERLRRALAEAPAGRSEAFRAALARLQGQDARKAIGSLAPGEQETLDQARADHDHLKAAEARLAQQRRLHVWLRGWTWLHVPVAVLLPLLVTWHALDAFDVPLRARRPSPSDFASPESCRECHRAQYDEWISSMHAMAQSSPTVDAQNRLVLAHERAQLESGERRLPLVGDLCVKCHAPTGSQPFLEDVEGPLTLLADRAEASRFGVSCVTCHQVTALHAEDPSTHPTERPWQNSENLIWRPGRVQHGIVGPEGSPPFVGNTGHQAERLAAMDSADFCASCHTVRAVDPEVSPERQKDDGVLALQDTWQEWRDGGEELNWSHLGVSCLHCHGSDLTSLVRLAETMERNDTPLTERVARMRQAVLAHAQAPALGSATPLAATPADGFDLPLGPRRRFLHTFVGVDHPLGTDVPYPSDHPRHADNARIRETMTARTADLLRIAAALHVTEVRRGEVEVEVANLATGHHLPAGFAFAREMWLEVAVRDTARADGWRVIVGGGGDGLPLTRGERLDKSARSGLRNFQAVLWTGAHGDDTVLQNQTKKVLKGKEAVANGFPDRVDFLLPGQSRPVVVPAPVERGQRVRVRLLFRALPPEFIEELASRTERTPADHLYPDGDAARRSREATLLRAMADDPPIHVMATDEG
ncbi:MAG: hypothetical protein KDB73_17280 [Planctomycetes bacterium]|nr:hypothetical protein [Planctomycetota bacterium]